MDDAVRKLLIRSNELDAAIDEKLALANFDSDDRTTAVSLLSGISREHAFAIRVLIGNEMFTAASALVRLQYESSVRAAWTLFAAPDDKILDLSKTVSAESEALIASQSPSIAKMLSAIADAGFVKAADEMTRFKQVNWTILNSIVHGGIRPLLLHRNGCSIDDVLNIVQTSNGLSTMTAMVLAIMSEDDDVMRSLSAIQRPFQDCLPTLIEHA